MSVGVYEPQLIVNIQLYWRSGAFQLLPIKVLIDCRRHIFSLASPISEHISSCTRDRLSSSALNLNLIQPAPASASTFCSFIAGPSTVMWPHLHFGALALLTIVCCSSASLTSGIGSISDLIPFLSQEASITYNRSTAQRWSDFHAPTPGAIINVATENDVAATVSASYSFPIMLRPNFQEGQIL